MKTTVTKILPFLMLSLALASQDAFAQRDATDQAFARLEESLAPEINDGTLSTQAIGPVLLVGARGAFEETQAWFPAAALENLTRAFGRGNVRLCEACLNPRVHIKNGRMEHNTALSLAEIAQLDRELRGDAAPARSAVWFDETPGGLAVRIVSIRNGQVLFSGNFDGRQQERTNTSRVYNATLELGRRLRGESLTHVIADAALLPNQHLSLDIVEQFGSYNNNLAGVTFSLLDPVLGVGMAYYRVIPVAWNLTLGAQLVVSLPTAAINALPGGNDVDSDFIDPLLTGVLVARMPIPHTNFAVVAMASTNLNLSIGVSFLNTSFLPFLP